MDPIPSAQERHQQLAVTARAFYNGGLDVNDRRLTRWYRVQMDSGPFSVGSNEYDFMRDIRDCCRRGVDFNVTWHDTSDEAFAGELGQQGAREDGTSAPATRTQEEVNGILRDRKASRDRAVGLTDRVLDEQGA